MVDLIRLPTRPISVLMIVVMALASGCSESSDSQPATSASGTVTVPNSKSSTTAVFGPVLATSTTPDTTTPDTTTPDTTTVAPPTSVSPTTTVAPLPEPLTFVPLDAAGPLTFAALADGQIELAAAYGTQASLLGVDVVVLEDPLAVQVNQRLVPVVRAGLMSREARAVLALVSSRLNSTELAALNRGVGVEQRPADEVAAEWLAAERLDRVFPRLSGSVRVMTSGSAETDVVARLYAAALRARGMTIEVLASPGSRELVIPALENGTVDMTIEYLGAYLTYLGIQPQGTLTAQLDALAAAVGPRGLRVYEPTEANDTNVIVARRDVARRLGLRSLSDLAMVLEPLRIGGPPDCQLRVECLIGLVQIYGIGVKVPSGDGYTLLAPPPVTATTTPR